MKSNEFVKETNKIKSKRIKMLISETQFRKLAQNVLNEQNLGTIKKTHLIKIKPDAKK
jgi:hypothetical protein